MFWATSRRDAGTRGRRPDYILLFYRQSTTSDGRHRVQVRPCDLSSHASTVSISRSVSTTLTVCFSNSLSLSIYRPVKCIMYNDGHDIITATIMIIIINNNRSQCFYEPCSVSVPHPNAGNFKCVYGPLVLIGQRSLLSSPSSPSPITPDDASDARLVFVIIFIVIVVVVYNILDILVHYCSGTCVYLLF